MNKRIEYNNIALGSVAYSIYINGNFVGTTVETSYTYHGTITEDTVVTVKSTYLNYSACESDGTNITITLAALTPPVEEPTTSTTTTTSSTTTNKSSTTSSTTKPNSTTSSTTKPVNNN